MLKAREAMKVWFVTLVVEGYGEFPIDMLRYEHAFPQTESESHALRDTGERRRVKLTCAAINPSWQPTYGRWNSFGWTVVQVGDRVVAS